MIEIDLLPGGGLPGKDPMPGGSAPRRRLRVDLRDRWILASGSVIVLCTVVSGALVFSGRGRAAGLASALESAARDSLRVSALVSEARSLESRIDSLADRAAIIRRLDSGRYMWPRLLDELARALPDEAWLVQIAQLGAEEGRTRFRIEGNTVGNVALSRFWDGLEASDFIHDVRLVSTEHLVEPLATPSRSRTAYSFVLEAEYQGGTPSGPDSVARSLAPAG